MLKIAQLLQNWYNINQRELPWRRTNNPYYIWVSEVILQQTRVQQGLNYYHKFLEKFPTIKSLANSAPDELLRVWQGLGYYSRARNMQTAAMQIIEKYHGIFPSTIKEIKNLKGVGDYTAAAIGSFCFNLPEPVLDGNVYRVLARIYGIYDTVPCSKYNNAFRQKAFQIIDQNNPAGFNQAIMEFGALQCTPKSPNCDICPLKDTCYAYTNNVINELPVKKGKAKTRTRNLNYFILETKDEIALQKREQNDIWVGLYQPLLIETPESTSIEKLLQNEFLIQLSNSQTLNIQSISKTYTHILSHQKLLAVFYHIQLQKKSSFKQDIQWIKKHEIMNLPLPRLIELYFLEKKLI